ALDCLLSEPVLICQLGAELLAPGGLDRLPGCGPGVDREIDRPFAILGPLAVGDRFQAGGKKIIVGLGPAEVQGADEYLDRVSEDRGLALLQAGFALTHSQLVFALMVRLRFKRGGSGVVILRDRTCSPRVVAQVTLEQAFDLLECSPFGLSCLPGP